MRSSLGDLSGVRQSDTAHEEHRLRRDLPRIAFTPTHAAVAILMLTILLSASLTMLVRQAIRYDAALTAANADTSTSVTLGKSEIAGTDGRDGDGTNGTDGDEGRGERSGADSDDGAGDRGGDDVDGGGDDDYADDNDAETNPLADDGRIDLNTATSEELQTVKGIGPVTAERILAHRRQIGRFTSVDQLLDVKGIGAKTLAKIRDGVTVR